MSLIGEHFEAAHTTPTAIAISNDSYCLDKAIFAHCLRKFLLSSCISTLYDLNLVASVAQLKVFNFVYNIFNLIFDGLEIFFNFDPSLFF